MYNNICNICDYLRDNAKETIKVIICIALIPVLFKIYGYIQTNHVVAEVKNVTQTEVTFELENGYTYPYKADDLTKFKIGQKWKVDMFDFENGNPYDDEIVKVNSKLD